MSISTDFGDASQWVHTHFGGVGLGDVRRNRRVVTLAAGWAREPGATIPRLSQAYAGKAAYQLLGHAQTTPEALQAPRHQHLSCTHKCVGGINFGPMAQFGDLRLEKKARFYGPRFSTGTAW